MNMNLYKQAGGTLLGLIIGLIIGLGIAVGVALMISKTPLPFTNKVVTPSDHINSQTGEPIDPNRPLYGSRPQATQTPPADDPSADVGAPLPPVEERSRSTTSAAETARAEAALNDTAEKWIYYLQAGAFRERADAESMRAKLALLGFEATASEHQAETGILYRVRLGPYGQVQAMNRVRSKLSENGIDVAVVRIGK